MKAPKLAHTETDRVLDALEAAPLVPLTDDEARALAQAQAQPNDEWRTHEQVAKAIADAKG